MPLSCLFHLTSTKKINYTADCDCNIMRLKMFQNFVENCRINEQNNNVGF